MAQTADCGTWRRYFLKTYERAIFALLRETTQSRDRRKINTIQMEALMQGNGSQIKHEEFDYIIVGAGSAGCVLANRLTASGKHSVLLLEAGPRDRNIWIHIPLGYGVLFRTPKVNWMYQTEPE